MIFVFILLILLIFLTAIFLIPYEISISDNQIKISRFNKSINFSVNDIIDAQETKERKKIRLTNFGVMKTYKEIDIVIINTSKGYFILKSTDENYDEVKGFLAEKYLK